MTDIDFVDDDNISSLRTSDSNEDREHKRGRYQQEEQEYTPLIPIVQRLLHQGEEKDRKIESLQHRNNILEKENMILKQQIREKDVQIEALQSHLRLMEGELIELRKGGILSFDPRALFKERVTTYHNLTPKRSSSKTVIETSSELPTTIIPDYANIRCPRLTFGAQGSEQCYLKFPYGVAIDDQRNIVVADSGNHRIQIFDSLGGFIRCFGKKGSKDGELWGPSDVAIDIEGNIIVSDANNHRIVVFDPTGVFIRKIGEFGEGLGQFNNPCGVAVDKRNGNVLVADSFNHRIQIFDPYLQPIKTFGYRGKRDGNFNRPTGVAVTTEGKIIVVDDRNHRFVVFDENGSFLYRFGRKGNRSREFSYPWGISLDPQENILITDQQNHRIQIFDRQGRFLTNIQCEPDTSPTGIAVSAAGDVVVVDGTHRVHIF